MQFSVVVVKIPTFNWNTVKSLLMTNFRAYNFERDWMLAPVYVVFGLTNWITEWQPDCGGLKNSSSFQTFLAKLLVVTLAYFAIQITIKGAKMKLFQRKMGKEEKKVFERKFLMVSINVLAVCGWLLSVLAYDPCCLLTAIVLI